MQNKTLVITRPLSNNNMLPGILQQSGYHIVHEPLLDIVLEHNIRFNLEQLLAGEPDAIIVTSKNAINALTVLNELRDLLLICVGEASAEHALSCGFTRAYSAGKNVEELIGHVAAAYDEGSCFIYAAGAHTSRDLQAALASCGMEVETVVVYEAVAATQFSDTLCEQLRRGHIGGVTFLSRRTGDIFHRLLAKAGLQESTRQMDAFCLSDQVAMALGQATWKHLYVAREPTLASLADCVDNAWANQD